MGYDLDRVLKLRRQWFASICWGLGVQIETYGDLPQKGGLLISNHRSYFDPIVVLSQVLALPVGKAEIRNWPIIGLGAKLSYVIFVDRKSKDGRHQARLDIKNTLQKGYCIMNYPEGTTHTLPYTKSFSPGVFKDAASENFIIYPIALEYQKTADAWVGDDTFIRHFIECFGKKKTLVKVSYGKALLGDNADNLILDSKKFIDLELKKLRTDWHEENLLNNEAKKMVS